MPFLDPRTEQVRVVKLTDTEIRRVAKEASAEADRIIRSLEGKTGVGARVRSAQLALAKANLEMWTAVGDATKIGIGDAFDSAAESQALFDDELFRRTGISSHYWRMSQLATSRAGIDSYIARKGVDGFSLSQRVWRNTAISRGYIEKAINTGLLLGKSVAEIAKDVSGYLNPNVPGGASYASMRLARTEVVNAYHASATAGYQRSPWVERVKWNLSGSHPKPDECNTYAEDEFVPGGGAGIWRVTDVPAKPHPMCLCFITPQVMDLDEFARNFRNGQYDSYIDGQMGCVSIA